MMNPIYVIDYDRSPKIVKLLIDYLDQYVEPEAHDELADLLHFLGVKK